MTQNFHILKYGLLIQSQKFFYHAKQSATDAFKTASKRVIQKAAGTTGDLIGNKIANAVAKSYDGRIHGFTISVPVLVLPASRQLLLRNGKISSKCLF